MNYKRHLETKLKNHFKRYKQAIVLLGARQVGKTTLLKRVFPDADYLLVDNEQTKKVLETYDINTYKQVLGNRSQLIIDELHLLSDPGRAVKIIYDQIEDIQLIVTGSSALHIKNKSSESMAGRKLDYKLFPLTFSEYLVQTEIEDELNFKILDNIINEKSAETNIFSASEILDQILQYGLYPETINLQLQSQEYLTELAESAIFKDIIELELIENRGKAKELLKLLAYQIGNLVNYSEIGERLSIDRRTVERYIDIFEQSYLLYRIYPFSKNKRDEIGKMPKVYFHDLGLRNALIGNFDGSKLRPDRGAMFENFIISELMKIIAYQGSDYEVNYWRLKNGAEVDIVLSKNGKIIGIEVKSGSGQISSSFTSRYPNAKTWMVNRENFY
ncbi:ATP-binding protein [Candidatus Dojkabacteria bacterium]|uniref:ATP-binding protein n=1 Tax=Candidatus Dojkabacteria bacterium TaxID=2099670 RepID=A0A955L2X0_9BACT|nr:ATP-binding protein [Candidatus Dojkabacteria bacterium]